MRTIITTLLAAIIVMAVALALTAPASHQPAHPVSEAKVAEFVHAAQVWERPQPPAWVPKDPAVQRAIAKLGAALFAEYVRHHPYEGVKFILRTLDI